jgi:hypothetical protein
MKALILGIILGGLVIPTFGQTPKCPDGDPCGKAANQQTPPPTPGIPPTTSWVKPCHRDGVGTWVVTYKNGFDDPDPCKKQNARQEQAEAKRARARAAEAQRKRAEATASYAALQKRVAVVRVTVNPDQVKGCKSLGIIGNEAGGDAEHRFTWLRAVTLDRGGNTALSVSNLNGILGEAYRCPEVKETK